MKKSAVILLLSLFYFFTVFLTLNRHSRTGIQNYHSEIWADKAGYYIYLPSFFIYNFDGKKLPKKIDTFTGNGFVIEKNIDSVYDDCTIVKVYSNWVFFDPEPGGFKQQFETECGDIIFDERKFKVGDKVNRKKHKK